MSRSKTRTILVFGPQGDWAAVRSILGQSRFKVVRVSSVDEVEELTPIASAIICDLQGAQGRGWKTVLEAAREKKPWITFIVSSYRADDKLLVEVVDAGGYCVTKKPFCKKELSGLFGEAGTKTINASCFV